MAVLALTRSRPDAAQRSSPRAARHRRETHGSGDSRITHSETGSMQTKTTPADEM